MTEHTLYQKLLRLPLLALVLLGASAQCPTVPTSSGTYGYLGSGGPAPYDATALVLTSMQRHASCCGGYWTSRVTRNTDGTYDIQAQMVNGPETHSHFDPGNAKLNAGGFFIVPWMFQPDTHRFYLG